MSNLNQASVTGASILLEDVTKNYGAKKPAVDRLTLEIPAGKTVMFVGPSGCGKTTTLKMINRLIEPTSGRIVINGEDVTGMNGDDLRRRIGYVIQAGGLLPHMTVAANIAIVPKMLGWDKRRIAARVDELLDLVSLDPEIYRNRYPRELSGGQQQRVGVARALAADPPVLLMDEPFGAVDPITRQRLQDELLQVQEELHKTVVFVTHDFDEAVKLGDWIVIFNEGGIIEQYATPEQILANPASRFVEDFIGSGTGLKQLRLTEIGNAELDPTVTAHPGEPSQDVLERMNHQGTDIAVILDERERVLGVASADQLSRTSTVVSTYPLDLPTIATRSTFDQALDAMITDGTSHALVTENRQRFAGLLSFDTVIRALGAAHSSPREVDVAPLGHNTGEIPVLTFDSDRKEWKQTPARGNQASTSQQVAEGEQ